MVLALIIKNQENDFSWKILLFKWLSYKYLRYKSWIIPLHEIQLQLINNNKISKITDKQDITTTNTYYEKIIILMTNFSIFFYHFVLF